MESSYRTREMSDNVYISNHCLRTETGTTEPGGLGGGGALAPHFLREWHFFCFSMRYVWRNKKKKKKKKTKKLLCWEISNAMSAVATLNYRPIILKYGAKLVTRWTL